MKELPIVESNMKKKEIVSSSELIHFMEVFAHHFVANYEKIFTFISLVCLALTILSQAYMKSRISIDAPFKPEANRSTPQFSTILQIIS